MGHAKHLDTEAKAFNWVIRQAHGDLNWVKGNHGVKLSKKDRELVEKSPERPFFSIRHDCSNLICFTTLNPIKAKSQRRWRSISPGSLGKEERQR